MRMIDIKLMSSQIQNFALNFTQVPGVSESPPFFGKRPWSFVVLVQVPPEADHISLQHPPLLRASHPGESVSEEETDIFHHGRFKGKVVKPKSPKLCFFCMTAPNLLMDR